ncbi:MAG TPA: hypothetical protein VFD92_16290 [Candidatus Binatia bacterium]|nr:hypothetical protein [Candidatus Binatia bacterium]
MTRDIAPPAREAPLAVEIRQASWLHPSADRLRIAAGQRPEMTAWGLLPGA